MQAMRLSLVICFALLPVACGGGGSAPPSIPQAPLFFAPFQRAEIVFGQPDFNRAAANQGGLPTGFTLSAPASCLGVSGGLYLADVENNRVLGFLLEPVLSSSSADFALGQVDLTSRADEVSASGMDCPVGLASDAGRLYVSEFRSHRVLIFNRLPGVSAAPADLALGQADLISSVEGTNPSRFSEPVGVCAAGGRLLVADAGNHRVLIWNTPPTVNGAPADLVLGQAAFNGSTSNRGGAPAADTLNNPFGVWTDGVRVAVADRNNSRVLIWSTFPTENGQPADLVLGQPDMTTISPSSGPSGLRLPTDLDAHGDQLFVADADNHRILFWDVFPTADGQAADGVLGQSDFNHVAPNDDDQDGFADAGPSARTLNGLGGFLFLCLAGKRLYVGDFRNNRLLCFLGT